MPRVHITFPPPDGVRRRLAEEQWDLTWSDTPDGQPRSDMLADVAGCDAVITLLTDRVDEEFLDAAGPQLRVVANDAVGTDNLDLPALRRRGVAASNTPEVLDAATAEIALGLVLATSRRIAEADRFVRTGTPWQWRTDLFVGRDLAGATLGIVGLGRIGLAVAHRAAAFGMRVIATPTRSGAAEAARRGIDLLPLEELLGAADVVSLHCPLTEETRHLIGARELALIGPEGILVNTARGPVVDEQALVTALTDGTLGAAGLDVYEDEPRVPAPLRELPNVVALPHIGSAGRTTRERMAQLAVDNVRAVLGGGDPVTPV
ncbi:D-glycerate dehydrogenase [Nocardioides panacisoli]|uniref:2-hydroxyacid dehydrogenase n=1 Tax=Nocardioides panacisoli TaxID=627624 RepID=UPI001C637D2E|nr:D-glycerate dehydrogenase [Nocardioides panacisoli]QYJ05083.1 D-glycerate dehydrogenase [Nocardioides panacisoli]